MTGAQSHRAIPGDAFITLVLGVLAHLPRAIHLRPLRLRRFLTAQPRKHDYACWSALSLEPAASLEHDVEAEAHEHHEPDRHRVAVLPPQFGHV